jgi:hypothetical protein
MVAARVKDVISNGSQSSVAQPAACAAPHMLVPLALKMCRNCTAA